MHLRSLPRPASLSSRTRHLSSSLRTAASSRSVTTSAPDPHANLIPWHLILANIPANGSDEKGKAEVEPDGGQVLHTTTKKSRRKSFKTLESLFMNPVSAQGKDSETPSSDGVVVQSGLWQDGVFKPLQDANKWKRNRVPKLAHGLGRVLLKPGVHRLRDPESHKYNFTPYLESIPRVSDFAFDKLPGFTPSSRDKDLIANAHQAKCKYIGSTSSLTGILTQIYLLMSLERSINTSKLSEEFEEAPRYFTPGQRIPTSVFLRYQNGVYTTDSDDSRDPCDEEMILLPLGTLLEKFLTLPENTFSKFLKSYTGKDHPKLRDVHRYAKHGKFLMRSQLDCVDDRLPGTGVFDLKTRAISAVRHDVYNYLNHTHISLERLTGRRDSFEEEYYDMIRAAFLEYSFQARIGNMDGVLVAYHNTARLFGFQYVSLKEMDLCLFGREGAGTRVFLRCVRIMEMLYKHITKCFPNQSVQCTFEKYKQNLRVWVEPLKNPNPRSQPPVVELRLSLTNVVNGKPTRDAKVIGTNAPWGIQFKLERVDEPQVEIRARRQKAYARQEAIAQSLPDAEPTMEAEAEAEFQEAKFEATLEDVVEEPAVEEPAVEVASPTKGGIPKGK